ncbi:hypothetical protein OU415_25495 [Saccharopolyspora sp. WRP15-2]|uniref:Uncharacterized protein n=1 Tax=Saccharopolyspora oryzae TaxID=2997343 RepID=A0ABT4V4B7_9PSEU|nr:hypothetical protein [Saccharopolyspora oryzae]MDA3628812.1 hypothetical protein [Saccharopolyspora oryzae]
MDWFFEVATKPWADNFLAFLKQELHPEIQRRHNVLPGDAGISLSPGAVDIPRAMRELLQRLVDID